MPKISDPIKIGKVELENRFIHAPTIMNLSGHLGYVTERMLAAYERIAKGGAALVIVNATAVHPTSFAWYRATALFDDTYIPGFTELAEIIKRTGAKAGIQISHGGPLVPAIPITLISGGKYTQAWGPNPVESAFKKGDFSKAMTEEEIEEVIEGFGQTALRVKRCGFDVVDIHCCHGSLFQPFMAKGTNDRQDKWGKDNTLFVRLAVERMRKYVGPDFPIMFRIAGDEHFEEPLPSGEIQTGFTIEDTVNTFVPALDKYIDCWDISAGRVGINSGAWAIQPLYFPRGVIVPLAEAVKKVTKLPVVAVGKIMDPRLAERIIETGRADLVAISRPIMSDPDYPKKALTGRSKEIRKCIGCNHCMEGLFKGGLAISCAVNAEFGWEREYRITRADEPKKVVVVGGGVAGMEAARVAQLRGHKVALYEKGEILGGLVNIASAHPRLYTRDLRNIVDYLIYEIERLGIKVELGKEITRELIDTLKPDVVIVATGSRPLIPEIPGIENPDVMIQDDYLRKKTKVGEKVVIIGGNDGAETAVSLARGKKEVTLVEESGDIAWPIYICDPMRQAWLCRYLKEAGVRVFARAKVTEITDEGVKIVYNEEEIPTPDFRNMSVAGKRVEVVDKEWKGEPLTIEADTVIIAPGRVSNKELTQSLRDKIEELYEIGDCVEPRSIYWAIKEAAYIARQI